MPDSYSERQAAELIRRAALLQATADDHGTGLSLDEVKRAAEAAGIDPAYVEQAALGAGDDAPVGAPFLGMQTGARRTRVVPGRVSDREWGKMVASLRRELGGSGTVETIGEVREWRRGPYRVMIEPEGETTRVSATAEWRGDTVGAVGFVGLMAATTLMMVAASVAKGKPDVLVIAAMFAVLTLAMGAFVWPRLWAKGPRIDGKLHRAMDALEQIAGADERAEALASAPPLPAEPLAPEAAPTEAARLDPDSLSDPAPASGAAAARQRLRG